MTAQARKKVTKHPIRAVITDGRQVYGFQLTEETFQQVLDNLKAIGVQYLPSKRSSDPCACR